MALSVRSSLLSQVAKSRRRAIRARGYASSAKETLEGDKLRIEFTDAYKMHKVDSPSLVTYTNRQELLDFYREMQLMRRMEVAADQMYKQKLIRGFLHLYIGQEAVAAGLESVLTKEDHVITAYRDHAHMVSRRCGGTVKEVLAELTGRITGCSKGKGGSMHMYKADSNFWGGNGIVGAQVPVGAGLALAQKYLKTGRVSMSYMGDGAANQGQNFEAYNMSMLWKLPSIFVVENNLYGMGTSVERASAATEFYTRGDYMPGIQVDAMDVFAVREAGKHAVKHAQTTGPILIEAVTYRYQGHSMSDPGTTYRSRDEIQKVRETRDCIEKVKGRLLRHNLATESEIAAIDKEIKVIVDEAVEFAKTSPEPPLGELWTNVYAEDVPVRGVEAAISYPGAGR